MKLPPPGYPCRVCGKVMHDTSEGRSMRAGSVKFVACLSCGAKIEAAARVGVTLVADGLRGLIQQKFPGLLPVMRQFHKAHAAAQEGQEP